MTKTTDGSLKAGTMQGWDFPIEFVEDVPLARTSQSLPINWAALVKAFQDNGKSPAIFIPKKFWTDGRKVPVSEVTKDKMQGRLKNAFTNYRTGVEKAQDGKLVDYGVTITPVITDGEWIGHRVYIVSQDVEQRQAAIDRAKNMHKKAAKRPAKKATTKRPAKAA